MPPDDPVFDTPPPTPTPPAAPNPAANGAAADAGGDPPAPPGEPNPTTQLTERVEALAKDMGAIRDFMGQVSQSLQGPQETPVPRTPEGDDELYQKFLTKPGEAIDERVAQVAMPWVTSIAESQAQQTFDRYRQEVDAKWGHGAYDAHINDRLTGIVKQAVQGNPAAVLQQEALRTTLNSLIGEKVDDLAKHQESAKTQAGERESKDFNTKMQAALQQLGVDATTLQGGIRRVPGQEQKLPEEADAYMAAQLRDAGRKVDPERLKTMLSTGPSYDDWLAAQKKLEGDKPSGDPQ